MTTIRQRFTSGDDLAAYDISEIQPDKIVRRQRHAESDNVPTCDSNSYKSREVIEAEYRVSRNIRGYQTHG